MLMLQLIRNFRAWRKYMNRCRGGRWSRPGFFDWLALGRPEVK